jgi:hypothetical protein
VRHEEEEIMKYRSSMLFNAGCLLFFMILLNGCASQIAVDEHSREWIARPLSELKQEMAKPDSYASKKGWKETTYSLANGNSVYVEPIGDDCFIHWEINSAGLIIGYQAKGVGCNQEPNYDDRLSRQKSRQDY